MGKLHPVRAGQRRLGRLTLRVARLRRCQGPAGLERPATGRGRASDPAKYALFAQWAEKEFGFKLDPSAAQFTVLQYKHFQASDLNKKFNEAKSAALAKGREAAAKSAAVRTKKAAPAPTTRPPAVKATAKVTAKAAPAKKAAAPAKATKTTRTRKAA